MWPKGHREWIREWTGENGQGKVVDPRDRVVFDRFGEVVFREEAWRGNWVDNGEREIETVIRDRRGGFGTVVEVEEDDEREREDAPEPESPAIKSEESDDGTVVGDAYSPFQLEAEDPVSQSASQRIEEHLRSLNRSRRRSRSKSVSSVMAKHSPRKQIGSMKRSSKKRPQSHSHSHSHSHSRPNATPFD